MDGLGDDFLARSGGAENQRIDGAAGNGESLTHHALHRFAMADDAAHVVFAPQRLHQMHVALLQAGAGLLQFAVALFQFLDQPGALELPRLHLDRHHAEGFGQALQLRRGRAGFRQFEQGVFIGGAAPGEIVAQPDQPFQHLCGVVLFSAHGSDLVMNDIRAFSAEDSAPSAALPPRGR